MGRPLGVSAIVGNLVWGVDGSVWACYRVTPFGYPHRSIGDAHAVHVRTTGALLSLPEEVLILSVVKRIPEGELTERIAAAADPIWGGSWASQARRTAAQVTADPVWERLWFLAIRLPDPTGASGLVDRLRSAASQVAGGFGLTHTPPGQSSVVRAQEVATGWEEQIGSHLHLTRLTGSQVRWIFQQAVSRGLTEARYPTIEKGEVSVVRLDRDAVYHEGGRPEDPARPRHRRYLTVDHPDHGVAYQAFACLAETPSQWSFPYGSGEWLWHLDDQLPCPVDWAIRVEKVGNDVARRRALRAKRNLVGQLTEPGGDPAGPATTLGSAAETVDEHRFRLEANPALPAFKSTTIVALAHRDLTVLERRAAVLESTFRAAEHNFYRPTGGQLDCLAAMLPANPPAAVVAEYAQDLLPDGLASAMPFAGSGVGDPGGMLLGRCLDTQYAQPVLLDPARGPRDLNRSASFAAVGELGTGKSFLAKTLAWNTVAMGGQVVAVDRTEVGEYAGLAPVVSGTSQVVEVTDDAGVCLDPFRVFTTVEARIRYGVGFLTLLTATPPASSAGAHLHRAAKQVLDQAGENGGRARLVDVVDALDRDGPAAETAEILDALSSVSYGPLVFGDSGPPVDLDADYVCFHIPGLRLPRRDAAREDLLPEELMGQAVLYLVAAFSRRVLFSRTDRFAALLLDEAHALTANPQGRSLVMDLIRDGRKHHAAVWAFTQLASDLTGDDRDGGLESLLGYRMVFRQSTHTTRSALEFLGSDTREANVDTVTRLATGQCLMRDLQGRLGLVAVAAPDDPEMAAAFSTTPLDETADSRWPSLNGHHNRRPTQLTAFGNSSLEDA